MAQFGLVLSLVDAYGGRSNRSVTVEAADFAGASTVASGFVSDYGDVTGMRILWYTLSEKQVWFGDTPDAGANRDAGMTFSMRKADNELASFQLPAPILGIITPDGNLDLTHAGVTALMSNFLSGAVRISDHEVVTELVSGKLDR